MEFPRSKEIGRVFIIFSMVLLSNIHCREATRVLSKEWELRGELVFQSLQRGPVAPSGPSGCTNVPGGSSSGGGGCPALGEMNVAGHRNPAPIAAFPDVVGRFGIASGLNDGRR
ncbi:hypothetical protein AMTRI_Chr03g53950 [Amborella trichopoda]|uniref:Uncharacterized protein n=1 Tax=Amborella trichopoda TaxID=13333 RepID=W1P1D1_AMBTC|nr:hypothetical protein AMTR_s00002p00260940 [Amborella trichopoda]